MSGHDIIVVGASAGGVEALSELARALPADLPAAVFVVLHVPPHGSSMLPKILARHGSLPAAHALDGEPIAPGRIYVAPPDAHMLIHRDGVRLSRGPRENRHRPAVDPLFRSAALAFGPRVIGVILTGSLDDGAAGLQAIKQCGGLALVQDPEEALYSGMPRAAFEAVAVDQVAPLAGLGVALDRLAREPVPETGDPPMPDEMETETRMAELDLGALQKADRPGEPSAFGCPDCGGVLWHIDDGELMRFRCRVGHAWTIHSLLAEQSDALEAALWTALRALEERAALSERLVERLRKRGNEATIQKFEAQAAQSRDQAALVRNVLLHTKPTDDEAGRTEPDEGGPASHE